MKRYDLQRCEGYDADCNAEMMETSLCDYVDAVEAINEIARLKEPLRQITSENVQHITTARYIARAALGRG